MLQGIPLAKLAHRPRNSQRVDAAFRDRGGSGVRLTEAIVCRNNVLMWSKKCEGQFGLLGENPMQPLPPQLELPEGDRFALPTISAVRELVPPGRQSPTHMVLMMICGKELWVPLDREIARQMASTLAPFRE